MSNWWCFVKETFFKEMFCYRRPFVKGTFCYIYVLLMRRFVWIIVNLMLISKVLLTRRFVRGHFVSASNKTSLVDKEKNKNGDKREIRLKSSRANKIRIGRSMKWMKVVRRKRRIMKADRKE
jgi:hypothetical protein